MKYDNIVNDIQILSCGGFIDRLEQQINKLCTNSMYRYESDDWDNICSLIELKRKYLLRYYYFGQIMQFFSKQERYIFYMYFYKGKTAEYMSKKLKISMRTFFRKLEKLNDRYNLIKAGVEGGGKNG